VHSYFFGGPATRTVKTLIIANVAVYLLQIAIHLLMGMGDNRFDGFLGLVPNTVTHNYSVWQFVTYMFLHVSVFHLFFNMLTLFMFGNELARKWGTPRFLRYYFITGIGAGICSWLVAINSGSTVIGASGAVYGLLLAYGVMYPNRIVYLNFLFPIKVKWLVILMGGVAFLSSITGADSGIAHIAHLGGMLVGYLYLKGSDWQYRYQVFNNQRRREQLKRQFEVYYGDVRRKIEQDKKQ